MFPAICTTQVKKRAKKRFLKRKKIMLRKFALRGFEPGPSVRTSVHWTTSVNSNNLSLKRCIFHFHGDWQFQGWLFRFRFFFNFGVELNLSLTEARRKARNRPINTLSGLVHVGERLRNLWTIDRAATDWTVWPYERPCQGKFRQATWPKK